MQVFETAGHPVKAWVDGVEFDAGARRQVENIAALPFVHQHVAVMPDVHLGKGATVGSVIPTVGAIVPAAVGVDIGCGMIAQKLTLTADDLPNDLRKVRSALEKVIPVGKGAHRNVPATVSGAWESGLAERYRAVVRRALHGPITPECPASLARLHPDAVLTLASYVAALPDIRLR